MSTPTLKFLRPAAAGRNTTTIPLRVSPQLATRLKSCRERASAARFEFDLSLILSGDIERICKALESDLAAIEGAAVEERA